MLRISLTMVLLTLPFFLGCGDGGPATYTVKGNVTLDGQPISSGSILLRDPSRQVGSAEAQIVNGVYELETLPGDKSVEISARKEVPLPGGKTNIEGDSTTFVESIPARYNTKSTLQLKVDSNLNQQDFSLKTKS
ncbi:hypothetical protein LOC68_06055 [Blastopirellula sp. JC732]|uniref:Carboxypeptidase regulatory-like domain-containing protein n=1 Tax=Blastopirellula sediminis TaxID=2894196 RepID=A0A9X1MJN2_9BACT|nr:hypothetical protein [Blastopirellula sediminis]MCC9609272.1 hypothetical protein [Blastopirellula sediminis]MCC9627951.1 hypothetical protein [Blastopirellula sediminis]